MGWFRYLGKLDASGAGGDAQWKSFPRCAEMRPNTKPGFYSLRGKDSRYYMACYCSVNVKISFCQVCCLPASLKTWRFMVLEMSRCFRSDGSIKNTQVENMDASPNYIAIYHERKLLEAYLYEESKSFFFWPYLPYLPKCSAHLSFFGLHLEVQIQLSLQSCVLFVDSFQLSQMQAWTRGNTDPTFPTAVATTPTKALGSAPESGVDPQIHALPNCYSHLLFPAANCYCDLCGWHDDKTDYGRSSIIRKFAN